MKKLLLITLPLVLIFSACGSNKVQEGEVEYEITYPNIEISGFMQAILPSNMTVSFKGTKMKTTISRGEIFTTEVITDEADNSVEMRLDFGDKLFYTILDANEIQEMIHSQPKYDIKSTTQSDSVSGMFATAYTVASKTDTISRSDAWFTEDLAPQKAGWFTSYAEIVGFPVIYDVERYGVLMHLEAITLTKREIKENEFDRDPALEEISFEEYEAEVQELFDILME